MNKLISILTLILFIPIAMAIPSFHQFYGNVEDTGGTVITDTVYVVTYIGGAPYSSTTSSNGQYGYSPLLFFVEDGIDGDTIEFYLNGYLATSQTFANEAGTELDLVLDESTGNVLCGNGLCDSWEDCDSCQNDCGACPSDDSPPGSGGSGGGGGGGGGGGERQCVEFWTCTGWGPETCPATRQQTRNCTDRNACGTTANKPNEIKACFYYVPPEEVVPPKEEPTPVEEEEEVEQLAPKEKIKIPPYIGYILTSGLILAMLVYMIFKFKPPEKKKTESTSSIKGYIRKYLKLNYPKKKIVEVCVKSGWKKSIIEKLINEGSGQLKRNKKKRQQKIKPVLLMLAILTLLFIDVLLVFKPATVNQSKDMKPIKVTGMAVNGGHENLPDSKKATFTKVFLVGWLILLFTIISKKTDKK